MSEFHSVATASEIPEGEMKQVELDGEEVVVANVEGRFFAFSNVCSHEGGPLGDGDLMDDIVACPWHGAEFNVATGAVLPGGPVGDPIPTYEVRLDGDDIQIRKPA